MMQPRVSLRAPRLRTLDRVAETGDCHAKIGPSRRAERRWEPV
jgi:hypothetical protein